ncbi:tetratricopeptide repeat protein [Erythrobacter litoralis]|uniref:TPR repeat-containing protein n=1 Tax=Erythrobacter litoralis (strain HTCC2594) TaxID=314225 RepID=Q2NAY3_ERYLH|nr:tetratricopeptide repeat protein [Erythrobacter litoralis]ABC63158.1 TPR repeat-containing protein [Erythrobacter litoralis HTCC2594]
MICTRKTLRGIFGVAVFALSLAACSENTPEQPPLERAIAALEDGDGFGAELILRKMLADGVERSAISAFLGEAELIQGQPAEARRWLAEGAFTDATAGRGFHMLGRLEMREGNLPAAGQAFDRAIAFIPDDPRLWTDIGRLRYRGGEQGLAVDAAEHAVKLGPENSEALLFMAQLTRDSHGMAAALPWFERAIAAKPDQLDLMAEYAATLGDAGEAQEALAVIRDIASRNPGYLRSYYLQAVLAARAGQYDLARKLLFRSGGFVNDTPAGILLSGIIDLETGNFASAAQNFDKLSRQQPENAQVRELLARSLAMGGNHRELVYRFDEVAREVSASPYLQALVARGHEALGNRDKAAGLIDSAAKKQAENLAAVKPSGDFDNRNRTSATSGQEALDLVRSYITSGRGPAAVTVAEDFRERFVGSADALSLAGDAALANRDVSRALDLYAQSARIRQSWPLARRRYFGLRAAGEAAQAQRLLEEYLIGHPGSTEPALLLARVHYDRGNSPRAGQLLDHALLAGGDRDPEILALRAVIALRMDQPELATRIARRGMEINPMHPATLQAMAMISREPLASALLAKANGSGNSPRVARR